MTDPDTRFWAVVPAGGAGTRLWPLSRSSSPKFLHDLTGSGRTLLQATADRLAPLCADRLLVVTGRAHVDAVRAQLPGVPDDQIVAEPSPRDSMPAIALAAAIIERRDPDAIIGSFAADHVIADQPAFLAAVREAVAVAATGALVTIGLQPTHAATGFGYIELGEPLAVPGAPHASAVRSFVEKPDAATAARWVEGGGHRWNAGMFVVGAGVLLDLLAQHHPELATGVRAIAADPASIDAGWPALTKIPIDTAVAEPAAAEGRVAVVSADLGWDDVGDFASLAPLLAAQPDRPGLRVLGDPAHVVALDAGGLVSTSGRTVVVLGLQDVVVVDTADAVLVTTAAHAQQVKRIVETLRAAGRDDLV